MKKPCVNFNILLLKFLHIILGWIFSPIVLFHSLLSSIFKDDSEFQVLELYHLL